jgi:hypothetical protein
MGMGTYDFQMKVRTPRSFVDAKMHTCELTVCVPYSGAGCLTGHVAHRTVPSGQCRACSVYTKAVIDVEEEVRVVSVRYRVARWSCVIRRIYFTTILIKRSQLAVRRTHIYILSLVYNNVAQVVLKNAQNAFINLLHVAITDEH